MKAHCFSRAAVGADRQWAGGSACGPPGSPDVHLGHLQPARRHHMDPQQPASTGAAHSNIIH